MAVNKAKVAIGFIVVGVLTVIFGTVLTFVGPIIIDDQIVKVSSMMDPSTVHTASLFSFYSQLKPLKGLRDDDRRVRAIMRNDLL